MSENKNVIKIKINDETQYEVIEKVVAVIFNEYRRSIEQASDNRISILDKTNIIKKFEKVIKCLRYEKLGSKEVRRSIDLNILRLLLLLNI